MQARAAYIRSIGTTGILVAAALLMLATVSALVAYEGWPGTADEDSVTSVPVDPPREVRVERPVTAELPTAVTAATRLVGREAAAPRATATGLVRDVGAGGVSTVGLVKVPAADASAPPAPPAAPVPAPAAPPVPVATPLVEEPHAPVPPPLAVPESLPVPLTEVNQVAAEMLGATIPGGEEQTGSPQAGLEGALDGLALTLP